jgi:hypothetical protein
MLNVAINAFICIIWMPLCGVGDVSLHGGADDLIGNVGIVFFFGMMFIGVTQLIHVIPLAIYFATKGQKDTKKGMLRAAGVTLVLWGIAFMIVSLA